MPPPTLDLRHRQIIICIWVAVSIPSVSPTPRAIYPAIPPSMDCQPRVEPSGYGSSPKLCLDRRRVCLAVHHHIMVDQAADATTQLSAIKMQDKIVTSPFFFINSLFRVCVFRLKSNKLYAYHSEIIKASKSLSRFIINKN